MSIEQLERDLLITEKRQEQLAIQKRRLVIDHSLVLHRDNPSVTDMEAMFGQLRRAGMPDYATLKIETTKSHVRFVATWSTDPKETEQ